MRNLVLLIAILLVVVTSTYACDNPIVDQDYILQPSQTRAVTWDFSDCQYGIQSFTIYAYRPEKGGYAAGLPPNTPLTMYATDTTTGERYLANSYFYVPVDGSNSVAGHKIVLTLTYNGKKPLPLEIDTTANLGGPP